MDNFTRLANEILTKLYENDQVPLGAGEQVVYSSEQETTEPVMIDSEEDTESLQKQPVADNDAVKIAQQLTSDPNKQPGSSANPQAKVSQAYGNLMNNLANKLNKISSNIK